MEWNDPTFLKIIKANQTTKKHTTASKFREELSKVVGPPSFLPFSSFFPPCYLSHPFLKAGPCACHVFLPQRLREANINSMWKPEKLRGKFWSVFFGFSTLLKPYGLVETLNFLEVTRGNTAGIAESE